ncbi:MAG: hypothetical protein Q8P67_22025, partial [archaeon]|nr:hypothetical protein [archaeon]
MYWSRFSSAPNTIFVVLATATRLYQFAGEGSLEEVFLPYHESPVFREIPGLSSDFISTSSNLSVLSTADGMAQSLIWITAQGLFYGEMLPRPNSHQDAILTDTKLIPFPTQPLHSVIRELLPSELMFEIPADVHLTPFHFLVLWPSSFQALSPISLSLVDSQDFSTATGPQSTLKAGEIFKGFVHDRAAHTLWIHSARSVFEIIVANEDRHIWELYLQKGMYAMALKFAQTPRQRQTILRSQSDHYLRRGDFVNAALLDAKTDQPFEEVALKFLHRNRAALKVYLGVRLEQLFVVSSATRGTESPKSMASQITMICTWMIELLLRKISRLQSKQRDTSPIAKELRDFLSKYAQHLDADTTLRLISSSGHTEELLFCSSLLGFHEQTVAHLCRQLPAPAHPGDTPEAAYARKTAPFVRALGIIDQHLSTKQHAEAVYRFAQPLFAQIPFECVSFWISKGPGVIDPKQLIPTIMGYVPQHNPPGETENQALRFLRACCSRAWNCREPSLHNYLFSLYARDKDEQP